MKIFLILLSFLFLFGSSQEKKNFAVKTGWTTISEVISLYRNLDDNGLSFEAFRLAIIGLKKLQQGQELINDTLLTIVDFNKPSSQKRLYIIDLKNQCVIEKSLVAHGKETGALYARNFSNQPGSRMSSLGFFLTGQTYYGKHGYSLRIKGLEQGINNNALERDIVFHGADYVNNNFVLAYGRLGRSFGCLALPIDKNQEVIDLIKDQVCVFAYYRSATYFKNSSFTKDATYSLQTAE